MPIRRTSNQSSQDTGFYNPEVYSDVGSRRIFEFDADALTYINAVEAADGEALEFNVKTAYNAFVVGCKSDGVWNAIKASCIMAGARTLSGALVPLVGVAPSGFNLASGDYSRDSGLKGDGVSMYLDSNRNNNADPQNSQHMVVFPTAVNSIDQDRVYIGAGLIAAGSTYFFTRTVDAAARNRSATANTGLPRGVANALIGLNRSSSSQFVYRRSNASQTVSRTSEAPLNANIFVFQGNGFSAFSDARLPFYSIGESLDLALLDNRVTALMSGIQNAIP